MAAASRPWRRRACRRSGADSPAARREGTAHSSRRVGVDEAGRDRASALKIPVISASAGEGAVQQRRDAGGFSALRALQPQFAQGPFGHFGVVDEGSGPYGIGKRHERLLLTPRSRVNRGGRRRQCGGGFGVRSPSFARLMRPRWTECTSSVNPQPPARGGLA